MCTCKHGTDRHFIDYAYGHGLWFGKCLEKGCPCILFKRDEAPAVSSGTLIQGGQVISGSSIVHPSFVSVTTPVFLT